MDVKMLTSGVWIYKIEMSVFTLLAMCGLA